MEASPSFKQLNIEQTSNMIQNLNKISNLLDQLASARSVNISNTSISCCARCCIPICCSDNYEYITSIEDKVLFKSRGELSCKISSTDRLSNFKSCKSLSFSQENPLNNERTLYCEMVKVSDSLCCGCGKVEFEVNKPNNNDNIFGKIIFDDECSDNANFCDSCECNKAECCEIKDSCLGKGCCYEKDDICDIYDSNKNKVYTICLIKYPLFPINFCCVPQFVIENNSEKEVGEIINISKNCCSFCGISGINYRYNIKFPSDPEATPELKLTIINALMLIDMTMY